MSWLVTEKKRTFFYRMHRPGCNKYLKIKHFSFIECLDFDEDIQSYPHDIPRFEMIWEITNLFYAFLILSEDMEKHGTYSS